VAARDAEAADRISNRREREIQTEAILESLDKIKEAALALAAANQPITFVRDDAGRIIGAR